MKTTTSYTKHNEARLNLAKSILGLCFIFCLMLASFRVLAQEVSTTKPSGQEVVSPSIKPILKDSIISIKNLRTQLDSAKVNDYIEIRVSTMKNIDSIGKLYANGILLPNAKKWKSNDIDKMIYFKLDTTVQAFLLTFLKNNSFEKTIVPVYFGLGTQKQQVTKFKVPIYIEVRQKISFYWMYAAAIILIILTIAALRNNILKDDNNLYYSLGRTQLFYWTILVIVAYIVISLKTDTLPDIPLSVLAILGISAATTAVSKIVENKAKDGVTIDTGAKSEGWFLDILSDGSSVNIQRFQNIAFNVFFGVVFLQKTFTSHLLPDFDNSVLLLLGISSGTYAGLKMTEASKEQKTDPKQTNDDAADGVGKTVTPSTPTGPAPGTQASSAPKASVSTAPIEGGSSGEDAS